MSGTFTHNDYHVGWICALPEELAAAEAMLDRVHPQLYLPRSDRNTFKFGSIRGHNIVLACLPTGKLSNNEAASLTMRMVTAFPSIRVGLVVGAAGGIPSKVTLGDVAVSVPESKPFPGVIEWDYGAIHDGGRFERRGTLKPPPRVLMSALDLLMEKYDRRGPKIQEYVDQAAQHFLVRRDQPRWTQPAVLESMLNRVGKRDLDGVKFHYGQVAAGNFEVRYDGLRDEIDQRFDGKILSMSTGAAGVVGALPSLVIQGISDYADAEPGSGWRELAAIIAAAYAKDLLGCLRPSDLY